MHLRRLSFALPPGRSTFRFYTSQTAPVTIGIRREDPERIWERRAPLTPDAVAELVDRDNVCVLIQECERRVFPLEEYVHVRTISASMFVAQSLSPTSRRRARRCTRPLNPLTWFSASKKHPFILLSRAQSAQSIRMF
jgi:hypothetical protein